MDNSNKTPQQQGDRQQAPGDEPKPPQSPNSPSLAQELGAVGGGIAGAAIGKSVKGNVGAVVGGIAGAIAGGLTADSAVSFAQEVLQETQPSLGLGANNQPVDLPAHYSWEELQALSKPQPTSPARHDP